MLKTKDYKLKTNFGFTLVELVIAITLSAILMSSVIIFVGSNIRNSTKNEIILNNLNKSQIFEDKLSNIINNIGVNGLLFSGSSIGTYSSGILIKNNSPEALISFIGTKSSTGFCDSFGDTANATGTVNKLIIKEINITNQNHSGSTNYYIDGGNNLVRKKSDNSIIIGNGNKGNNLITDNPIESELNNPNAIIEVSNILYISDYGNNRILAYSGGNIYEIIGEKEGINNPTDIFFDNGLYIANSGNNEILYLYDSNGIGSEFNSTFISPINKSFDKIDITLNGYSNLTSPISSGSFTFTGITKNIDDTVIINGNKISYYFSGVSNSLSGGNQYSIKIDNLSPTPSDNKSYFGTIEFYNSGSTDKEIINSNLFVKGDGNIITKTGNILKVLSGGLNMPNNIISNSTWSEGFSNLSLLIENSSGKILESELPIKDIKYELNGDLLNIIILYYKYYDCVNENHIITEKVYKKYLK